MNIRTYIQDMHIRKAILHFTGWPDAGNIIQHTLSEFREIIPCKPAATWDLDGFWNTESVRPQALIKHGQIRKIDWPSYEFTVCEPLDSEPILIGSGPEPTCRWRSFTEEALNLLKRWRCEEVILLGSFYDHVSHEEAVISGVVRDSHDYNRVRDLGCGLIEYEGPGAIHAALMRAAGKANIRSLAFWVHFPFYLTGRHELIMARLLGVLSGLLGIRFDTESLCEDWKDREKEIEELILQNRDLRNMIEAMKKGDLGDERPASISKVIRIDDFIKRRNEPDEE